MADTSADRTAETAAGDAQPLAGQHAIVTGGGRGIGAAIAEALARRGARLTLLGRDKTRLDERGAAIAAAWDVDTLALAADVTDESALQQALATAIETAGAPAILVNNAGIARSAPFHRTDDALWHDMLDVDLMGAVRCIRCVLPAMLEAGYGRIINVASTAGITGYAYVTAYCAAKHALVGLTRSLAMETAKKGVTVNAVCPGYTDTDIVAETVANIVAKTGRSAEEAIQDLASHNPQQRLVRPDEVAEAVAFLCLPSSAAITGQAIPIAGGELMP